MTPRGTLKRGRSQTLAVLREIAERWHGDPDPLKRWGAQAAAAAIEADGIPPGNSRNAAITRAFGLYGRLDLQQHRIRVAVEGIKSTRARREAVRAAGLLRGIDDATVDQRIRRALA